MAENDRQKTSGPMTYPKKGTFNRFLFKTPLIWWRMGLGKLISHRALGGRKMLVLTSWGRISQVPRHTMLSYVLVGDREYVCSGWGARADWYKNILANPQVTVQVGAKVYSATARRVEDIDEYTTITREMFETGGDSHFEAWLESFGIDFDPRDMVAKRDRLYLVGFDANDQHGPPPLPSDLKWVWGFAIICLLVGAWLKLK